MNVKEVTSLAVVGVREELISDGVSITVPSATQYESLSSYLFGLPETTCGIYAVVASP
jgi:hypothetical protein